MFDLQGINSFKNILGYTKVVEGGGKKSRLMRVREQGCRPSVVNGV